MCTNISLQKKDHVISARTMDWFEPFPTVVNFVPRGQLFPDVELPGEIKWKNKYGYVGAGNSAGNFLTYSDGLNETGLSAASLWLAGSKYPKPKLETNLLYNINLVNYILGNFRDINQVIKELSNLLVVNITEVVPSSRAPLHFIISDASGDHLIVEFIDEEMRTYTNKTGILTNDPSYDWQIANRIN